MVMRLCGINLPIMMVSPLGSPDLISKRKLKVPVLVLIHIVTNRMTIPFLHKTLLELEATCEMSTKGKQCNVGRG